jgi:hypothetical protein
MSNIVAHITTPANQVPVEQLHSKLSPSSSGRWTECPGSVNLIEKLGVVSQKTSYSIFGDVCHDIGAQGLRYLFEGGPLPVYPAHDDEGIREVVEPYVKHVLEGSQEFPACGHVKQWGVWVERRFSLRLIHKDVWGTGDCIVYCPTCKELRGIDLKSGSGHEVEAHNNPQLSIYMLLAMFEFDLGGPVESLRIEISQPRAPSGRTHKVWRPTVTQLMDWLTWIQERAQATEAADAPLAPGDHCKDSFCPALGACPAWRNRITSLAAVGFKKPIDAQKKLDIEYLVKVLEWAPALKDLIENAHHIAYTEASRGVTIPGWKLVKKRDGNRKYTNETEAMRAFADHIKTQKEISPGDMWKPRQLLSPAQAEKIFPEELVNSLCTRESGGTTLAPESDKRPAVSAATVDAKQIFGAPEPKKLPPL